jgi:hypothetical protein
VAVAWALQPVMAMAAANMTVVMTLAGRIATPPELHDPRWVQGISVTEASHALATAKYRGQRETTSTRSRSRLETSAPATTMWFCSTLALVGGPAIPWAGCCSASGHRSG